MHLRVRGNDRAGYRVEAVEGLRVVTLRPDLPAKALAEALAAHLRREIGAKLTRAACPGCAGVGGCFRCDS